MVKIYVEGIADVVFLRQYIKYHYGIGLNEDSIVELKGWNNISKEAILTQLRKNEDEGITNLVILDADSEPDKRRQEVIAVADSGNVSFDLFLMPDNLSQGALEELLMRIVNPANRPVIDCWDRYEEDLGRQTIPWKTPQTPTVPSIKTRVYAYLEALLGNSNSQKKLIKEQERIYTNPYHWNLDSPELEPLKTFLDKYFQ